MAAEPSWGRAVIKLDGMTTDDMDLLWCEPSLVTQPSHRIRVDRSARREEVELLACRLPDVLVTSGYLPIQMSSQRLMVNQSYHELAKWFPAMRPLIADGLYTLTCEPIPIEEPHVVIGGPIDGVWYHWLVSWVPRIFALKRLRPDIFSDPTVKFLIDEAASKPPFLDVLLAMGIAPGRLRFIKRDYDYLLKDAVLVSFPDQRYLYPELVLDLVETLKAAFATEPAGGRPRRRIYASRQGFPTARRRIRNWTEVSAVLDTFGFEVVELGNVSARDQVSMFADAEFVLGVHGSDLSNLMFCPSDAKVLVIENQRNVEAGISASLDILAQACGVGYRHMIVEEYIDPNTDYSAFPMVHNRDVIVPPEDLAGQLLAMGCLPSPDARSVR